MHSSIYLDGREFSVICDDADASPLRQVDREDECLHLTEVTGCNQVRFWRNRDCLVVSAADTRLPDYKLAVTKLAAQGIDVVARSTGGTAVANVVGTLNISFSYRLAMGEVFSIERSYERLLAPLIGYLASLGIVAHSGSVAGSYCNGSHDLVVADKKIAGTAQRVRRSGAGTSVLSHLCLSVSGDADLADELVNEFYTLAGSDVRINPGCATSVSTQLESGSESLSVDEFQSGLIEYLSQH